MAFLRRGRRREGMAPNPRRVSPLQRVAHDPALSRRVHRLKHDEQAAASAELAVGEKLLLQQTKVLSLGEERLLRSIPPLRPPWGGGSVDAGEGEVGSGAQQLFHPPKLVGARRAR